MRNIEAIMYICQAIISNLTDTLHLHQLYYLNLLKLIKYYDTRCITFYFYLLWKPQYLNFI